MTDYRGGHQPFEAGAFLYDMTVLFGEDIYTNPQWYVHTGENAYERESIRIFKSVRNQPEAEVIIYRAVPPGVSEINPGDWVSISKGYAEQHAMQSESPDEDWPVISMTVKAKDVRTGGSDLLEWGYFPLDT